MRRYMLTVLAVAGLLLLNGCAVPKINLFPSGTEPLQEFTIQGTEEGKVLVIPINGIITDFQREKLFYTTPSMVQEVVSQLNKAEKDKEVKAVLFKINSPGGTITASDVLYHEILAFKRRTGCKVVVAMMDLATSGGYYVSLPADFILAHPTTLTGSVGVIFIRPKITGLMGKIGLEMEVNKSGKNKDMASPFRETTKEEEKILQALTDEMGKRFIDLVAKNRKLDKKRMAEISTARVYLAEQALDLGLVDKVGYLKDAISEAKRLAGLKKDARVVVYRRSEYANDNIYNTSTTKYMGGSNALIDLGLADSVASLRPGFYYLWTPAAGFE